MHERERDRDLAEAQERPAAGAVMRQVAPSIWARARAAKEEPRAPKSTACLNESSLVASVHMNFPFLYTDLIPRRVPPLEPPSYRCRGVTVPSNATTRSRL